MIKNQGTGRRCAMMGTASTISEVRWYSPAATGDRPDRVGVPPFFKGGVASSRESFFEGKSSVRGSPPQEEEGGEGAS